jgi:protocatechuate 3,4-dioxygenase beta subunit
MRTIFFSLIIPILAANAMAASTNAPFHFGGRVIESDGRPVAGATVALYAYGEGYPLHPAADLELRQQVTTEADGSFTLPLPRASALFVARKTGLAPAWRQSWNARRDLTDQQLVLSAPSALAGVVVDEADKPVADASVFVAVAITETELPGGARTFSYLTGKLARDLFNVRTAADGRFRIEGFPAEVGVDLAVQVAGKALRSPGRESMGPDSMPWRGGDQTIKLVVEPAGSIEGKVVVQDGGQPLGDAQLVLQPQQGGFFGAAVTDPARSGADGTFKIKDVAPAAYRVRAIFGTNTPPDWVAETVPVTVEVSQVIRGVQVAAVRGGLLQVRVTSKADHEAISEANISAYKEDFQAGAMSAADGVAILRLLPGDYQINSSRDNWRGDNVTASVQAGETNRVDLELSPPPKVVGIVRRSDGQPAVGAEVRVVGRGPQDGVEIKTDKNGRFETEWDPRNYGGMNGTTCLLIRMPEDGLAVAQDIDEETGPLDLRLAPGLTLVGQVKSPDGQSITNLTVGLLVRTGNMGIYLNGLATKTNVPGHFEIPALPPGRRYGLSVGAKGYGQRFINELATDTAEGKIELDPIELNVANLPLAGQLVDSEDKPVAGVFVNLHGEGQPNDNTRTDRQGRFKFEHVCEGPVQLFANARNTFGNTSAQGGETNVVIRLGERQARMASGSPPQRIKGTVTGLDGKPAAGARVRLLSPMNFGGSWSRTDSNGVYRITSNSMPRQMGNILLVARDTAGKLAGAAELAEGATQQDIELEMGGVISGRVQDSDGKPVAKATFELMLATNHMESAWEEKPVHPDAQGQFEIGGLPTGLSYHLYATAPGYGRTRQEITFPESFAPKINLPALVLKPANLLLAGQVLNENQKPVPNAQVQISGDDQPQTSTSTDRQGRFKLQVCEGPVRLFVYAGESFGNSTVDGGETNAQITLTSRSRSVRQPPQRRALKGSPLPDLASVGLGSNALSTGAPCLLCLLDWEERHSRRALRRLTEKMDDLKHKGISLVIVQAMPTTDDTWQDLKSSIGAEPLALGRVSAKSPQTRWATESAKFPRLILVNKQGRVAADGFTLDELEAKLKDLGE